MDNSRINIGQTIVRLRKARHLSQETLANEAGVDRRYLSDLENDKRNPSLEIAMRLAAYFNLSLSQFFRLVEQVDMPVPSEILCEHGYEDAIVFQSPDYAEAFVGISDCGRAIYSYSAMIASLVAEGMDAEDAIEFIDYNTIRALPYMGSHAPIILHDI